MVIQPLIRHIDMLNHIPVIGVGPVGIRSVPESLFPRLRQPHLLGLLVKAGEVRLVVALRGIAPQAVEVPLGLHGEAVILAEGTAVDLPAVAPAVAAHGTKAFQHGFPQLVHNLLEFCLELLRVQLLRPSGPPGVIEGLPTAAEVYADVANGTQFFIPFRRLGIKQPRLLEGSGAQDVLSRVLGTGQMLLTAELRQRDRLLIGQNQVLHFSLCGGSLLKRLGG